jgi:hypothetical protein
VTIVSYLIFQNVAATAGYIFLIMGTVLLVPSLCMLLSSSLRDEVSESTDVEMAISPLYNVVHGNTQFFR